MSAPPATADQLRDAYVDFFSQRGHTPVASASLIPHDPTILFTVAGMVPFKPYFVGDETPPFKRAVTVQKSARAGGKHNDLDDVGRTKRHLVFFEMMGNFSFGDYFKSDAIPWSWELVTDEVRLERHHARDGEQDARIVRDEARRCDRRVSTLSEETRVGIAKLIGGGRRRAHGLASLSLGSRRPSGRFAR